VIAVPKGGKKMPPKKPAKKAGKKAAPKKSKGGY
jgi:hypothetical protein